MPTQRPRQQSSEARKTVEIARNLTTCLLSQPTSPTRPRFFSSLLEEGSEREKREATAALRIWEA